MFRFQINTRRLLNAALSFLALAAIIALFFAYREHTRIVAPILPISLRHLPYYAFCSFYRMLAAYVTRADFLDCLRPGRGPRPACTNAS